MRKLFVIIAFLSIMLSLYTPASALSNPLDKCYEDAEILFFDDGSYLITTLSDNSKNNAYSVAAITIPKIGTKTADYYSNSGELLWRYTLVGEFNVVNGVSAVCTNATSNQTINSSSWGFYDEDTYVQNNVAKGKGVFKKKVLLVTLETIDIDLTISCDEYGNFS